MTKVIYMGFKGKMTKVTEPRLPNNRNFLIRWKGMDWSGFRTLQGCVEQFDELEKHSQGVDDFTVVET